MTATRRQILRTGLVAGTAIVAGVKVKLVQAATSAADMFSFFNLEQPELVYTSYPTREGFVELIGDQFWVDMGPAESMLSLRLSEVVDVDADTFILVFRTRDARKLAQDTYRVDHATIGPVAIFMGHNPVTQRRYLEEFVRGGEQKVARRYIYEAVFNYRGLSRI